MNLKNDILEWLRTFSVNQLKQIVTIKSPTNVDFIKKIMSYQPDCKPIDRISHGYSETKVQNEKSFYVRDKYRYKKRKEEKMAMEKLLFENITVSRDCPWSFSVRKSFIKSEELKRCMLLFSDDLAFSYCEVKQVHVKLGSQKNPTSIWFYPSQIHSFSEWVIYLFELEIFEAYRLHKKEKNFPANTLNHFTYVEEHVTKQFVKKCLDNLLSLYSEKRLSGKYAKKSSKRSNLFDIDYESEDEPEGMLEISLEEAPYIAARCMERIEDSSRELDQIIFQFEWYSEDRKSKVNRILKDLCKIIVKKFKEFEIDVRAKEIEAMSQSKKKKRKGKKAKDSNSDDLEKKEEKHAQNQIQAIIKKQELTIDEFSKRGHQKSEQQISKEIKSQDCSKGKENQSKDKELHQNKSSQSKEEKSKEKPKKNGKQKPKTKQKKENSLQKIQAAERQQAFMKSKKVEVDREKEQAKKVRKVVKQRINQHILFYYQQLCLSSQSIDKYRKICIETIENSIKEMQLKFQWEMIVFGSYSIDFSLRESDLDIVIVVDDPDSFSLHNLKQHLRVQEWLRQCNIIQIQSAKVDILEFEIILACLKHPKLKDPKKLKDVIHVDISLGHRNQPHEGIRNTAIMKKIFTQYPNLKTVSLVLKELLKIYQLNKPFRGGIGSYVLVILVHNIIKMGKLQMNDDYFQQLIEVCCFMTQTFQPYKTLISPYSNTALVPNPKLQLNIEDHEDKVLLNTTKIRQINQIIGLFDQFKMLLTDIELNLQEINLEERKKMKRLFFEKWNILFKPHEEAYEIEK